MSIKKAKNSENKINLSENSPETVLGKVLFARQKVEQMQDLLNQLSSFIVQNNSVLEGELAETSNVPPVLELLENLSTEVVVKIRNLV